jgi:alanine racemase
MSLFASCKPTKSDYKLKAIMNTNNLNTWLEISETAYKSNLSFFRKLLPRETEFSVVIKSNAYGHGLAEIAALATNHGADSFCVHSLEEALSLKKNGFQQDVLIMGPVLRSRLPEVVQNDFRIVLYNLESFLQLAEISHKLKKKTRIHLKLETGTFRQGIIETDLPKFLQNRKKFSYPAIEGAYTHFANIEDTTNHQYAFGQLKLFQNMIDMIREETQSNLKVHAACSAAILLFPQTYFDMVRLGISQYGLWPSRETYVSYKIKHADNSENVLSPVLTWKSRIAQIKETSKNQAIGYGGTYQTTRKSKIAVIPVGYADGYDRGLSNQSYVIIKGQRAPVRGRVCMNLIMVDITDIPDVRLEDEVILLGQHGKNEISADYLASLCGTINYEFVTRINPEIPRIISP